VWPDRVAGWAPDPMFSPGMPRRVAGQTDLVHLHFGFDHLGPAEIRRWLAELDEAQLPLVLTVHDLRNPHHDTPTAQDAALGMLIPAAAALITLTPGAAVEIVRRFGRPAEVLPHPTPLASPERSADVVREPGLVLLHLKSLRRNLGDPERLVRAAAAGARRARGRLRVDLHPEAAEDRRLDTVLGPGGPAGVEFAIHPRFSDAGLERYLRSGQVSVLPHRWGSHSGWLELARDLGTRVVAPDCGYYREQWDEVVSYGNNERSGLDELSLSRAVEQALRQPMATAADRSSRLAERAAVRRAHEQIYRRVARLVRDGSAGRR
jgi:glycosyltransferase involved in cell wall biosynthesis